MNLSTTKPSGVDKLNGYRHAGDTAIVSQESKWGIFRTGAWYDWAYTDRYQYPSNILTQLDTPLANFHEHFITQSFQPFAEFEWHATRKLVITAGIKAADYKMTLNQFQDNGKTVGCLGGTLTAFPTTAGHWPAPRICIGGAAFVTHSQSTTTTGCPSLAARYRIWRQWSDLRPVRRRQHHSAERRVRRAGWQCSDAAQAHHRQDLSGRLGPETQPLYPGYGCLLCAFPERLRFLLRPDCPDTVFVATGPINTKGIEAEGNFAIGWGLSLYANASFGSAKYQTGPNFPNGGEWVANTPNNIEGVSLLYQHRNWDMGLIYKRVGQLLAGQRLAELHDQRSQAFRIRSIRPYQIQPWDLVNVFFNYTIKNTSLLSRHEDPVRGQQPGQQPRARRDHPRHLRQP